MTVGEGRLTQFALSASNDGQAAAVRMTIYDSQGNKVFTLVAKAGKKTTTGTVWLPIGTYTVVSTPPPRPGRRSPGSLTTSSSGSGVARSTRIRSTRRVHPPPPPDGQITITDPAPAPPPDPIDPISDPYANT